MLYKQYQESFNLIDKKLTQIIKNQDYIKDGGQANVILIEIEKLKIKIDHIKDKVVELKYL